MTDWETKDTMFPTRADIPVTPAGTPDPRSDYKQAAEYKKSSPSATPSFGGGGASPVADFDADGM